MKRLRSRLRNRTSTVYRRLSAPTTASETKEPETMQEPPPPKATVAPFTGQTSFRSQLQLSGSSMVCIWFESVQDTGIRFSLLSPFLLIIVRLLFSIGYKRFRQ